jgi:2,3-bisphosphoglycerate-dependent phosphoglycerate mutase
MEKRMPGTLVLVRHGQSEWNLKNLFTGWKDPDLTDKGVSEAHAAGKALAARNMHFDIAYTSDLSRAQRTLKIILGELGQDALETRRDLALNERDYGDLAGMNKDEAREKFGEDQVHIWRRSYDVPPPGGESLKDTMARTVPYFVTDILPDVMGGKGVIVAAHGNSLRSICMVLDRLSKEQILKYEIGTGIPIIYTFNADTTVASKETLAG